MQPVESEFERDLHPGRRPNSLQDDLVHNRLAVPVLRRLDHPCHRKVPMRPNPFPLSSFSFSRSVSSDRKAPAHDGSTLIPDSQRAWQDEAAPPPEGSDSEPSGRRSFSSTIDSTRIQPHVRSSLSRDNPPSSISPAYNNPLISPPLGRDVGPGISPVTMLRWCRQPSPSKATLALFLFVTGAKSPGQGRSPGPLEFGNATHESPFPSCVQE